MWMAGGGIKGSVSVGQTDEIGSKAVENRFHVKNLHATMPPNLALIPISSVTSMTSISGW